MNAASLHRPPAGERLARQIIVLALPIIGVTASRTIMGTLDFFMVSRLGTDSLAAISPATILIYAIMSLGLGTAGIVQTFAAQADGRGEAKQGSAYAWQSIYLALLTAPLVWPAVRALPGLFEFIGELSNTTPEVRRLEAEYSIALWSFTPAVICTGLESYFNGIQKARIGLIATLISLPIDAVGNYVLIFGKWGFPQMGIEGAALTTNIGWGVRAAILMWFFLAPEFNRSHATRAAWRFDLAKFRAIIFVGLPAALQWMVEICAWTIFMMIIVPPFGTPALAASNIVIQYMHFSFMPAIGLGAALCSLVGFAVGEGDLPKAERLTRVAARMTIGYMVTMGVLFLTFRRFFIGVLDSNEEVIAAGIVILIWVALYQAFDAMMIVYTNALRGAGETQWPAIYTGVTCWVFFVGGGFAMVRFFPQLGVSGPWMMATAYVTLLGFGLFLRFKHGAWKKIQLFKPKAEAGPAATPGAIAAAPADPA